MIYVVVILSLIFSGYIGYLIGKIPDEKFDGTFLINTTSVKDEILQLNLTTDLDDLKAKGEMRIKVEVQ